MTRVEFTRKIINLLARMYLENESPIIDYVKRSDAEQMHLYIEGKSQCDGVRKISQHQIGRAIDIYFLGDDGKLCDPIKGHEYWHQVWEEIGGNPMLTWDKGHFEVKK